MKDTNNGKFLITGTLAALAASLCCITPVLALFAGISGAASAFSFLDPFRPLLIAATVLVLGFAWYQKLKPNKEPDCACENEPDKTIFFQSKKFLAGVTFLAFLMLSFPYYAHALFPEPVNENARLSQSNLHHVRLNIDGMTCSGCEGTVNQVLSSKKGVIKVISSYRNGYAEVAYDSAVIHPENLKKAIEEEIGYEVVSIEKTSGVPLIK